MILQSRTYGRRQNNLHALKVVQAKKAAFALMIALLFVLPLGGITKAFAATSGVAVADVNLRAGPATRYPVVIVMPQNASLAVHGCVADQSWCDVGWSGNRGWVSARYIHVFYNGQKTVLTPVIAPVVGITTVTFTAAYWDSYYRSYSWHRQWHHYHGNASRSVVAGCGDRGCGAAAITHGPYGGTRAAAGGCRDGNCGAAAVTRGPHGGSRAAIGGCGPDRCGGAAVTRGPLGNTRIRHGSFERP